jgi:hypothetical protein
VLNIIPACATCNSSKSNKRAHLWIYERFGMQEGRKIVARIVEYLTIVKEEEEDDCKTNGETAEES